MEKNMILEMKLKAVSLAFFCIFIGILLGGVFVITALGGLLP